MILSTTLGSESYSPSVHIHAYTNCLVRETHRRSITQLILLTRQNLPQNSPHNLPTSRLWKIRDDKDSLGSSERTDTLPNLQDEIFAELVVDFVAVFDGDECIDCLTSEFVVDSYYGSFGYGVVLDERGFDFGG